MSIIQRFLEDLNAISVESKRKNTDIKQAADAAAGSLLNFVNTKGGSSLADQLKEHDQVIDPLILSCKSRNPKLAILSLKSLSSLAMSNLIPNSKVGEIIDGLMEATNTNADTQVKILQILPGFFQGYSSEINDTRLSTILNVCSTLQGANRQPAIAHTAQAMFTQLLDTAFQKVCIEDELLSEVSEDERITLCTNKVTIDDDKVLEVADCAYDTYRLFSDLCTLIEHHKPTFLKTNYISEDYGFEILESLVKNNKKLFLVHNELGFLLRTKVAPILLRFLSSSKDFSLMVRVSRLIFLLIDEAFDVLKAESEVTLSLLTHILSKDSGSPSWKRIMALEIYSGLFKNFDLTKKMFIEYDNNKEEVRKPVLHDILNFCCNILDDNKSSLNTGELIQRQTRGDSFSNSSIQGTKHEDQASQKSNFDRSQGLSSKTSNVAIPYLECIEKSDPPATPPTYHLLLIQTITKSLIDGLVYFISELTGDLENGFKFIEPDQLAESKLELLLYAKEFLLAIETSVLQILDILLYSTLDNHIFLSTLQAMEDLCRSAGITGLEKQKHDILKSIAGKTLKIEGKPQYQSKVFSISESIVDTISSTLGQAVSNISQQQAPDASLKRHQFKFYSRNINSRQIFCFRSLINLAITLGERLDKDWLIISLTLQWISYFVDGQSGAKHKDLPQISPYLNNNDLQMIQTCLENLNVGLRNSSNQMFNSFAHSLIQISDTALTEIDQLGQTPFDSNGDLLPCPFNKLYAANKLTDISVVDPIKFIVSSPETCELITGYFSMLAKNRDFDDEIRLLCCRNLDSILKACATAGFSYNSPDVNYKTECSVLSALYKFILSLSQLPDSEELLIINCEVKMYLQNLDTLKSVIDKYGSLIKKNWNVVTSMLNFPFMFIEKYNLTILGESTVKEIIVLIIRSAFETLKVILDEVLQSIPKNQIKVVIDSLHNFVTQDFDLNISFNSVSYLWIVNDYIKENIDSLESSHLLDNVNTKEGLLKIFVNDSNEASILNDYSYFFYLWLYLVLKFSNTIFDERVRVRDAAIITFFDIIDTIPIDISSWKLIFDLILQPVILEYNFNIDISDKSSSLEWMNSYKTLYSNITKLFIDKLNKVEETEKIIECWDSLIKFFSTALRLNYGWVELNKEIFVSYGKIINSFDKSKSHSSKLLQNLYQIWAEVKIIYEIDNPKAYQESLLALVQSFTSSFELFGQIMDLNHFERMLDVLVECISYPVLETRKDNKKCSPLQQEILNTLSKLDFNDDVVQYQSIFVKKLKNIIILPFEKYERFLVAFEDKDVAINTFIFASNNAMDILVEHLNKHSNFFDLINNNTLADIFETLLIVSKKKNGNYITVDLDVADSKKYLWMKSLNILVTIINKFTKFLSELKPVELKGLKTKSLTDLMACVLAALNCCFQPFESEGTKFNSEALDLPNYESLKRSILILFNKFDKSNSDFQISESQIEYLLSSLWKMSFYYQEDALFCSVVPSSESFTIMEMEKLSELLTDECACDIYGMTSTLKINPRLHIAKRCLSDLADMVDPKAFPNMWQYAMPFLLSRYALALRKYILDVQMLGCRPIPKIQETELDSVVTGLKLVLSKLSQNQENIKKVKVLYPVLIRCLTTNKKINGVEIGYVCTQLGSL